jgi:hypothetical protein
MEDDVNPDDLKHYQADARRIAQETSRHNVMAFTPLFVAGMKFQNTPLKQPANAVLFDGITRCIASFTVSMASALQSDAPTLAPLSATGFLRAANAHSLDIFEAVRNGIISPEVMASFDQHGNLSRFDFREYLQGDAS